MVTLRELTRDDVPSVRRCFETLSPATRYLRYGRAAITAEDAIGWVAELDGRRRAAVGATDPATGMAVGAARYVSDGPASAEIAVTVTDAWQGHGVGRALLGALLPLAEANGIRRLHAQIMVGSRPAIRLMARAGGHRTAPSAGGVLEYEAELVRERANA